MARRATGGFGILRHEPGNPEFPTLPDGVKTIHFIELDGAAARAVRGNPVVVRKWSGAPGRDEQRFAGWHTDTTWVNPTTVDFGVIPSPVQRTLSLYNARFEAIEVTALSLPAGVSIVGSPSLPLTIPPYAGITLTLEAGITGDNSFDEFGEFTTSEGQVPVRFIGRRVFTLAVNPQTPMIETLNWRTDILRSTDGTEKAYSLMRSPLSVVEYNLRFTDDLSRIRFHNEYLGGSSALVVAAEKWYEKRNLKFPIASADTSVNVDMNPVNASFEAGGPFVVVAPDGTAVNSLIEGISLAPDELGDQVQLMVNFDGPDGATSATDESQNENPVNFVGGASQIDDAQSPFGASSSLWVNNSNDGVQIPSADWMNIGDGDWTIEFWFRPTGGDLTGGGLVPVLLSRYDTLSGAGATEHPWYIDLQTTSIRFIYGRFGFSVSTATFSFSSPREVQLDTWHYLTLERQGGSLYCWIGDQQVGATYNIGSHYIVDSDFDRMQVGGYYNGGSRKPFDGWIADLRWTTGVARYGGEAPTVPTERIADPTDLYQVFTLSTEFGTDMPLGSYVMPLGLGYTSQFPTYETYQDNLEEASYRITLNQEPDVAALPASFATLSDGLSPETFIPILEDCNVIENGRAKVAKLDRAEYALDSGLTNRIAFNQFNYASISSTYKINLYSEDEVWEWRQFLHYIAGSYRVFYVPTFKNDIPGVTATAGNTFTANTTSLTKLFGNPPANPRLALRFEYPDGTILFRRITALVDNGATEDITVNSPINAGSPKISFMREARILGDTASFKHNTNTDVELIFSYRTILK